MGSFLLDKVDLQIIQIKLMNNKKLKMKVAMWRMGDCIFQIIVNSFLF